MLSHTIPLNGRADRLRLTGDEASELYERGFRFSIFNPATSEYYLSLPLEKLIDHTHGTITILQPEK